AAAIANTETPVDSQASLTSEQIARYWSDGFLTIDGVFSPEEVADLRAAAAASDIAQAQAQQGADAQTVHLLGLTSRHPAFHALARDPRIIRLLAPLMGPDIQLQHSKLATKPLTKGRGAFAWHQDFAYYPHTNTDLLAVMVMLDDATPDNGCMRMVRGSHRLGMLEHRINGFFSGGCTETSRWADPASVVDITPKAGGISIHHCLTLHGSDVNHSGLPRRGVVYSYRADDAYQLGDDVFDDTGLVVAGVRRGVVRCENARFLLPLSNSPHRPNVFGTAWNQQGKRAEAFNSQHAPVVQPSEMP
ncbi:MAG: phytanoyl-CoA dioxygenase family protein, partial [Planctomycetes bacterium]|nr:phytanoyl-CoA dioxygenase family protein [Planctomycetota bacterium]